MCSAANAALVLGLGAARVIDYAVEDFTQGDARWDVVMDCVGATDYARCHRVLTPGGRLVRVVWRAKTWVVGAARWVSVIGAEAQAQAVWLVGGVTAAFTRMVRPSRDEPSIAEVAAEAASSVAKVTKPKPRERPVSRSEMTLASVTSP